MGNWRIEKRISKKTNKEYLVLIVSINNRDYYVFDYASIYKIIAENNLSIE